MAGFADKIYLDSPIWVQQVIVAVYGVWWYRRRYGHHFERLYAEIKVRDSWTSAQFREYQEKKLMELLIIAQNSQYYSETFKETGINPTHSPYENLEKLPLLAKETLRTRARDLLTQNSIPEGTVVFKSSGTTGTPTEIYYSPEFHGLELAISAVRSLGWAGVPYTSRRVMFGVRKVCRFDQSRPPFWRYSPIEDMAYASIYHLSPKYLPYYVDFLRSYHPAIVMGYPSALATVARFALEHSQFLAPVKVVVTSAETVTAIDREVIEAAWQCKLFDRYGAVEGCVFVAQCQFGRYHVSPDIGIVEIVDQNGKPVLPGQMGEVICTGLQNTLQPLIRYRIGDVARWAISQNCPCGHLMPILEGIEGRFEDICYTPDGREMLRFDTVFKGVETIREAQVVQEKLDQFVIKVVPTVDFNHHDEEIIQANMKLHVGTTVNVSIEKVNHIPRTESGKFRAVVCKLTQEEKQSLRCIAQV